MVMTRAKKFATRIALPLVPAVPYEECTDNGATLNADGVLTMLSLSTAHLQEGN